MKKTYYQCNGCRITFAGSINEGAPQQTECPFCRSKDVVQVNSRWRLLHSFLKPVSSTGCSPRNGFS